MDQQKTPATMTVPALLLAHARKKRCQEILLLFVSLCLGILIWLLVVGADQMDMTLTVPIEILNLPKNLVIYNQPQKEVSVTLRGPRSIMQEMRNRSLSLPVDMTGAEPDTVVLNADSLNLQLPGGISVVRFQPASITLSIDQMAQKHIPVEPATEGQVAAGYMLHEITLNPDRILVSGPQALLERQQSLKTYLINLDGMTRTATLPIHLNLSPELLNLIGETTVAAKIVIKEKFIEKIIHGIPVNIRDASGPVILKPDAVSVFVSIPESLLADPQSLPQLFTATASIGSGELPRTVAVEVVAATVPGHEPTVIKSHTPQEVTVLPVESKPEPEEQKPEKKKK